MSGKAMEYAVPPGTAIREVLRRIEESGHASFAASLLHTNQAFPAPKPANSVIAITLPGK